jgi:hypothetical protein
MSVKEKIGLTIFTIMLVLLLIAFLCKNFHYQIHA